jgi:hypothetical protein
MYFAFLRFSFTTSLGFFGSVLFGIGLVAGLLFEVVVADHHEAEEVVLTGEGLLFCEGGLLVVVGLGAGVVTGLMRAFAIALAIAVFTALEVPVAQVMVLTGLD